MSIPLRKTCSSRYSSLLCKSIGELFIGEKPNAGMPLLRRKRASVAPGQIIGKTWMFLWGWKKVKTDLIERVYTSDKFTVAKLYLQLFTSFLKADPIRVTVVHSCFGKQRVLIDKFICYAWPRLLYRFHYHFFSKFLRPSIWSYSDVNNCSYFSWNDIWLQTSLNTNKFDR